MNLSLRALTSLPDKMYGKLFRKLVDRKSRVAPRPLAYSRQGLGKPPVGKTLSARERDMHLSASIGGSPVLPGGHGIPGADQSGGLQRLPVLLKSSSALATCQRKIKSWDKCRHALRRRL